MASRMCVNRFHTPPARARWLTIPRHPSVWQYLVSNPLVHVLQPSSSFPARLSSSYANSVLQALYFCSPFRELVCNTPDRSYLYPPHPTQHLPTSPSAPATQSRSANHSKAAAVTSHKRGPAAAAAAAAATHASPDPKPDPSTPPDADGKDASSGPPIPPHSPTLFAALRYLFLHIAHHSLDKGTVAPTAFVAKLRKENELFRNTQHQDAHEFLNYLLNKIVEELEQEDREAAKRPSPPSQNNPDDCESADPKTQKPKPYLGRCPLTRHTESSHAVSIMLTCTVPVFTVSKSVGSLASSAARSTASSATTTNSGSGSGSHSSGSSSGSASGSTSSSQPPSHATLVHNLFEGTLTSETRCLTCETVRHPTFLTLIPTPLSYE
jgi:ubiquitin carboxyl-terminal hydrolase 9/13